MQANAVSGASVKKKALFERFMLRVLWSSLLFFCMEIIGIVGVAWSDHIRNPVEFGYLWF